MSSSYIYRTYTASGDRTALRDRLLGLLESQEYRVLDDQGDTISLSYPKITFSSTKPLTCISKMSLSFQSEGEDTLSVRFGMTFTKIKFFTIFIMTLVCAVIPALVSYWLHGAVDIPTPAYLGIPLGFMLHYHVRWRVFNAVRRLLKQAETEAAA